MASAPVVVRRCFGRLGRLRLHIDVERSVVRALTAAAPGPSGALVDAGLEAGLAKDALLARVSAAFLNFAAFNLSDDIADGQCDYLSREEASAVLLILNNLFFSALRTLSLPKELELQVMADLLAAEEAQVLEITTTRWDAERLMAVTDGAAGRQWSAYLTLIWAGTPLSDRANDIARGIGRVGLLAGDISNGDVRFTSLSPGDRYVVVDRALASVRDLKAAQFDFTSATLTQSEPTLLEEFARLLSDGCCASPSRQS